VSNTKAADRDGDRYNFGRSGNCFVLPLRLAGMGRQQLDELKENCASKEDLS
jgi:hypothetical protein